MKKFLSKIAKYSDCAMILFYGFLFLLIFVAIVQLIDNYENWLGFVGSIIGTLGGLYGVRYSVVKQNESLMKQQDRLDQQRREDLAVEYKPILTADPSVVDTFGLAYRNLSFPRVSYGMANFEKINYNDLNDIESNKCNMIFGIKNIGRGNLNHAKIISLKLSHPEVFDNYMQECTNKISINNLVPGESMAIVVNFPRFLRVKNEYLNQRELNNSIIITFEYTDEFGIRSYIFDLYIRFNVTYSKTSLESQVEGVSIIDARYNPLTFMPVLKEKTNV